MNARAVWILLFACGGCNDIPSADGLSVAIGVEDKDEECIQLCSVQSEDFTHPLLCDVGKSRDCGLAPEERYRVLIDYGKISLKSGARIDPAVVEVFADDVQVQATTTGSVKTADTSNASFEGHYFAATALSHPPPRHVFELVAKVDGGGGLYGESDAVSVLAPQVLLSVPGCTSPCRPERGVGDFVVEATTVATIQEELAYVEQWLDGIPQTIQTTSLNLYDDQKKIARFVLTAPTAGSKWMLVARVGEYRSTVVEYELRAPTLSLDLTSCTPDACQLKIGGTVSVRIRAPAGFAASSAQLSSRLNGVPVPGTVSVNMQTFTDESGDAVSVGDAFINVAAGKEGDVWQAVGSLGAHEVFSQQAILVE